ncbi:hypothetical protein VTK73DRAFT_9471 [Phialemonium thermophilum]|uniref:Mucin n=1 Tax=Phialemonium thermophilum TaxID=223376 RepID=A0ABR3Y4A7_9PEZI
MPGSIRASKPSGRRTRSANTSTAPDWSETEGISWRPNSARSRHSNRPSSALLARWTRRNQHHQSPQEDVGPQRAYEPQSPTLSPEKPGFSSQGNKGGIRDRSRSSNLTRTASVQKRQSRGGPPSLSRDEFEALPLAIQRKYFSTLERLRFAQESGTDLISRHYDAITTQNFKRRKPRRSLVAPDNLAVGRNWMSEGDRSHSETSAVFADFHGNSKSCHFTGNEQSTFGRDHSRSVLLDPADEAIYKVGQRTGSRPITKPEQDKLLPRTPWYRPKTMDSREDVLLSSPNRNAIIPESFYESFRWLDEEDNLDLRLYLDDYHANLREDLPSPVQDRRPTFRRRLSISKLPFNRSSLSNSRPGTKDAASSSTPITPSSLSPTASVSAHGRRKSRALSLITPKHDRQDSTGTIDPAAAHYQDPEARLKLRVYLASPQKFDEAIEFGFPSTEVLPHSTERAPCVKGRGQSRHLLSVDTPNLRSFLADEDDDDKVSMDSQQPSAADPDSPKTPRTFEKPPSKPSRASTDPAHAQPYKPSDGGYAQMPASSREMTLRMTLTRPDLRAHEDQIYGWQQKTLHHAAKRSQGTNLRSESSTNLTYIGGGGEGMPKDSIDKVFAGIDHWNASSADGNVMRRIWNRVRRS